MANSAGFIKGLETYNRQLKRGVAKSIGEFGAGYYNALVQRNIRYTGYSQSRWQLRVGPNQVPSLGTPPERVQIRDFYPTPAAQKLDLKEISSLVITNDAPYINELDRRLELVLGATAAVIGLLDDRYMRNLPK